MTVETARMVLKATDDMNGAEIALAVIIRDQQRQIDELRRIVSFMSVRSSSDPMPTPEGAQQHTAALSGSFTAEALHA